MVQNRIDSGGGGGDALLLLLMMIDECCDLCRLHVTSIGVTWHSAMHALIYVELTELRLQSVALFAYGWSSVVVVGRKV